MRPTLFSAIVCFVLTIVACTPVNAGCGPLGCAARGAAVGGRLKSGVGRVLGFQRRQARRAARGG